jgi:hypothetical protein
MGPQETARRLKEYRESIKRQEQAKATYDADVQKYAAMYNNVQNALDALEQQVKNINDARQQLPEEPSQQDWEKMAEVMVVAKQRREAAHSAIEALPQEVPQALKNSYQAKLDMLRKSIQQPPPSPTSSASSSRSAAPVAVSGTPQTKTEKTIIDQIKEHVEIVQQIKKDAITYLYTIQTPDAFKDYKDFLIPATTKALGHQAEIEKLIDQVSEQEPELPDALQQQPIIERDCKFLETLQNFLASFEDVQQLRTIYEQLSSQLTQTQHIYASFLEDETIQALIGKKKYATEEIKKAQELILKVRTAAKNEQDKMVALIQQKKRIPTILTEDYLRQSKKILRSIHTTLDPDQIFPPQSHLEKTITPEIPVPPAMSSLPVPQQQQQPSAEFQQQQRVKLNALFKNLIDKLTDDKVSVQEQEKARKAFIQGTEDQREERLGLINPLIKDPRLKKIGWDLLLEIELSDRIVAWKSWQRKIDAATKEAAKVKGDTSKYRAALEEVKKLESHQKTEVITGGMGFNTAIIKLKEDGDISDQQGHYFKMRLLAATRQAEEKSAAAQEAPITINEAAETQVLSLLSNYCDAKYCDNNQAEQTGIWKQIEAKFDTISPTLKEFAQQINQAIEAVNSFKLTGDIQSTGIRQVSKKINGIKTRLLSKTKNETAAISLHTKVGDYWYVVQIIMWKLKNKPDKMQEILGNIQDDELQKALIEKYEKDGLKVPEISGTDTSREVKK